MSDLIQRIASLSPEKRALLESYLLKNKASLDIRRDIPKREITGPCPLSFAQQRLWFLDQLEPNSSLYNIPISIRMKGKINVDNLQKALNVILERHSSLRTIFISTDGLPTQIVSEKCHIDLPLTDLSGHAISEREEEAKRLVKEEFHRPFDLTKDLMIRASLLRMDDEDHILVVVMHHIASDGWSIRVLFSELSILYKAFMAGSPSPLPDLSVQYTDYAVWQRERFQGGALETQRAYWKRKFDKIPPALELPTDGTRSAPQIHLGEEQVLVLPRELADELKALSQKEGVTLFMTLLAAFKVVLYRYTRQEDITLGIPIAGRNQVEIEGLIGFFVNTLVLRTNLSDNLSFLDLLERVRNVAVEAYTHQDLPFEKLVEELQPERDLSRHPLFDVLFNFFSGPQVNFEIDGVETSIFMKSIEPESKFAMTLYVMNEDGRLKLRLVYQKELYSSQRMLAILRQYEHLLQQIVDNPEKQISSYSLVTPECRKLLPDPGEPIIEPYYEPITDVFLSLADKNERIAVSQGYDTWTYCQLSESSQAVARLLLTRGIKRGDVVGIIGQKSFGLIASIIGTLLSGGVMLTIDSRFPIQRQKTMIRESCAKYLLYVNSKEPGDEWSQETLEIINIAPDAGRYNNTDQDNDLENVELPNMTPDDKAYVFFTSGSTGTPKGILGCHKGVSHFLNWQSKTFAIGSTDRCAQLTNLSFDVLLRDVFLPLTNGATLCLPTEGLEPASSQILTWLERERISILHVVPSLAQSWLSDVPPGVSLRHLKWVFFAGEPLTDTLIYRWREAFPKSGQIVNLYGPTETTMVKCSYIVPSNPTQGVQPIGFPLPETQALILSKNNQLCGISEPGEIVLRTPFRTLGYINAPEENQRRFVKNVERNSVSSGRNGISTYNDEKDLLYYTGDEGRYRPDSSIDILGRLDNQIKIKGIRIEPEEIEARLNQHPDVWQSAIIALKTSPGEKNLVAYIVPKKGHKSAISSIRRFLRQSLPEYMIPSNYVTLESLPLTPNGKIDRRALPLMGISHPELEVTYVSPQNTVEQKIADIWAKVLGLEKVGIHDNFFDLGGHSLIATRVISRTSREFNIDLPLRVIFELPTIAELAGFIVQEQVKQFEQMDSQTLEGILKELDQLFKNGQT